MDATFVALKTSNVRAEPTTGSDRVGQLTRDDAVAVTSKVKEGNWYRIEYEGETAYIFGTLIKEIDPGELAAWENVADTYEQSDVAAFLRDYPKGHFAERANVLFAALAPPPEPEPEAEVSEPQNEREMLFWETIKNSTDPAMFEAYLEEFPNGDFVALARLRIKQLEETQMAAIAPSEPVGQPPIDKLRGYGIWVRINNYELGQSICRRLEKAGLTVECDSTYGNVTGSDIFLTCATLPADTGQIIQDYLGMYGFAVHDWRSDDDYASNCNNYGAIAIEIQD